MEGVRGETRHTGPGRAWASMRASPLHPHCRMPRCPADACAPAMARAKLGTGPALCAGDEMSGAVLGLRCQLHVSALQGHAGLGPPRRNMRRRRVRTNKRMHLRGFSISIRLAQKRLSARQRWHRLPGRCQACVRQGSQHTRGCKRAGGVLGCAARLPTRQGRRRLRLGRGGHSRKVGEKRTRSAHGLERFLSMREGREWREGSEALGDGRHVPVLMDWNMPFSLLKMPPLLGVAAPPRGESGPPACGVRQGKLQAPHDVAT